jgi:hypothetical protein
MGLIPIILVVVLTLLLWGMLNYNSFIFKKSQADLAYIQLEKGWNQRSSELLELHTLLKINELKMSDTLLKLANQPEDAEKYNLSDELKAVATIPQLSGNTDLTKVINDLLTTETQVEKLRKKYIATALDYNKQVEEMPSRYIALLFGFKTLPM